MSNSDIFIGIVVTAGLLIIFIVFIVDKALCKNRKKSFLDGPF
jgi:hypothetical protein